MAGLEIGLGLMAVVAGLAWLARRLKVPVSILLVVAGCGIGWIPGLPRVGLPSELFLGFLLPVLLYPPAIFMPWRDFRQNIRPISLLALGLVLFTLAGVGITAHWLIPELPLASALVLGAIVSPTDALAATSIAQRMNVPQRIQRVIEGEGLVNDATGLVGYRIALTAVVTGSFSWGHAGLEFIQMSGGGIGFGLLVGWVVAQIQRRIDDPLIEITISLLTPFAAYLPALKLGLSGVLAVVSAGLFLGWRVPLIHKAQVRLQAVPVWETVQFVFNGLVFLLIGLELPLIIHEVQGTPGLTLAWEAAAMSVAVIAIRALWVFAAAYLPRLLVPRLRARSPFPDWRHVALVAWTGMRGAVSLAAALGLPHATADGSPFPGRYIILFLTYSVILATLVGQGLTLPHFIRWLGTTGGGETENEERQARLKVNRAALARLDEFKGQAPKELLEQVRAEYAHRVRRLEAAVPNEGQPTTDYRSAYTRLQEAALEAARRTLIELRDERAINDEVLRHIQRELDLSESRLKRNP